MASLGVMSSTTSTISGSIMGPKRWYFGGDQLTNTPSVRAGMTLEKELSYRQQSANFIQDMGQKLEVTQLCINTAIVYMQRFYMFHSFTRFNRNSISSSALFLAAKVEEQPRKLEHVIKVAHMCLHRGQPHNLDPRSEEYQEKAQELVTNENILLQTLGFDVAIDHPHTHVVRGCQLVKAAKELAQTSYFMATNSLHLTTMCLRYPPTIVACVCIHLACKWSKYRIPLSAQNKEWFSYIDNEASHDLLESLTQEFLAIFERCPSRLKKKIMASTQSKEDEDKRLAQKKGEYDPTPMFAAANAASGSQSRSSSGHHRSSQGQKHHHHHHHHGHHHRGSSSSSATAPAASSSNSMANVQHHISKHVNPAMFDPNSRRMKSESSKPSVPPQMMPQMMNQQQQMVPNQFVNNHHQLVDQFGRPIQKSSSSSSSRQPIQHHHQQQRQQQVWPDQRNMSLPYPQQQQKVSSHQRPSSHQHRHSMGHDPRWQQNMKQPHLDTVKPSMPPLPPQQPPLPPSEPKPPPPPMPPSPVTSMKPPKSIFDIDSPPAQPPPITSSTLSEPKIEAKMPGDIFEPDTEEVKPKKEELDQRASIKLNKVEEMSGFEKLRDGSSSIKLPKDEPKSMLVSIPLQASSTTSSNNEVFSSSSSSHKKHKKEKKSKKDKKEKRDKYQNGEMSSSKKHKHKHRDRDKESNSGLKLKIKPIAPGANPEIVQPLKICIGGSSSAASNASNSKKRHRQQSDSSNSSMDSIADPARKMSRVMGTSTEQESSFLSGRANFNYKKKVIT